MPQDRELPFEKDDSRLRILYLYRMLRDHTDESHTMSTGDIQERMTAEHGITMHRTTLSRDIEVLRAAGVEVISERKRSLRYYLADRPLSLPELRLLIDAVLSSKFITEKKSRELVEKLIALNGEADADKLRRTIHVTGKAKSDNEKGYYIVDAINEGINLGKRISFTYIDFDNRKKPVRRNAGAPYTVSPYDLIWDGDYYYLTGYCDERGEVRTFRVDRIEKQPEILDEPIIPKPEDYRVERYTREVFRMFASSETAEVTLLCENELMKAVIDMFGTDVRTKPVGDNRFRAKARVSISPNFFRWVFAWNGQVILEGPNKIRQQYKNMLERELARY